MPNLIARFKNFNAIKEFILSHPDLIVNRMYNFWEKVNVKKMTPQAAKLYHTVLILPRKETKKKAGLMKTIHLELSQNPDVAYVQYDLPYELCSGELTIPPPQNKNAWWFKAMNCVNALNTYQPVPGKIVKIAVIDSGIMQAHKDLDDFSNNPVARDFTDLRWEDSGTTNGGQILTNPHGDPIIITDADNGDYGHHGSHVAGIIGALENVQTHTIGIAHQGRLINFRAFNNNVFKPTDSVLSIAVRAAVDLGAQVINASWASKRKDADNINALREAVDYACSKGVVMVCAAGNYDENISDYYPAGFDNVIVAGALKQPPENNLGAFRKTDTSNYGSRVIGAPGSLIASLDAANPNALREDSGTSMAAAFISGLVARMIEIDPGLVEFPDGVPEFCNLAALFQLRIKTKQSTSTRPNIPPIIDVDATINNAYNLRIIRQDSLPRPIKPQD